MSTTEEHLLSEVDFDPFLGPAVVQVVPAMPAQLDVWLACQTGGEDACRSINQTFSLRFTGVFNQEAMVDAVHILVKRHELLRAAFSPDGLQICIFSNLETELVFRDITKLDAAPREAFLAAHAEKETGVPFDLVHGPMCRFSLLKLEPEVFCLFMTVHQIVCDKWSVHILINDLAAIYSSLSSNMVPSLPAPEDFSAVAMQHSATERNAECAEYWAAQLKNAPILDLPVDMPAQPVKTYHTRHSARALDNTVLEALAATGAAQGCSLATTLIAAFELFLHRLCGQNDLVMGLAAQPIGRSGVVGHFVGILPLRSLYSGVQTFNDYLALRHPVILDAYDHQDISFGDILGKAAILRDHSRTPLAPVVFNISTGLSAGTGFPGLQCSVTSHPAQFCNFELFVSITGVSGSLNMEWSSNPTLISDAAVARMMDNFEYLLAAFAHQPDVRMKDIGFGTRLPMDPRIKLWNATDVSYPKDIAVYDLFRIAAAREPDKTALRFGNRSLTYKELDSISDKLATHLQYQGIEKEEIIALVAERSPEMVIALLAIMKAGAAYLPIDTDLPADRIAYMLSDAHARKILVSRRYQQQPYIASGSIILEDALSKCIQYHENELVNVNISGHSLAYMLYTSGTSGKPNGVLVEHHNLVNFLLAMQLRPGISAADKLLAVTTISFDISALELFLPLVTGATLILADSAETRDGRLLMSIVKREGVTIMQGTPATWRLMLDGGWDRPLPLKVLCGGEVLHKELSDKLLRVCGALWNMYGPTETTIWSACRHIAAREELISLGKPVNNTRIYILDKNEQPVPAGVTGYIYIAGAGVARGYHGRPALTGERFLPDPFSDASGDRMYMTGDLGYYLDDGNIQFAGRSDTQVKIKGTRVELQEIESLLMQQQGVRQAVAVVSEERLLAFIVAEDAEAEARLPFWKQAMRLFLPLPMIPADVYLIKKLPLTPGGKLDRSALTDGYLRQQNEARKFAAAVTPAERLIAGIWAGVLQLEQVSINDDFFELGGNSQLAALAMAQLTRQTGTHLPLGALFAAPTVARLAHKVVSNTAGRPLGSLTALKARGTKPPLYIVHGFDMNVHSFSALSRFLDGDQPVFGFQPGVLEDINEPMPRMEHIAAQYVSEVLTQNPQGPYALAGYSFGAYIAFEMAMQLKARGKEVMLLAMIDAHAGSDDHGQSSALSLGKKLLQQFPKMMFGMGGKHTREEGDQQLANKKAGGKKGDAHPTVQDMILDRYNYVYQHYNMQQYDGVIDLFRMKEKVFLLEEPRYSGWKAFTTRGVRVHELPGDHDTFLMAPHNQEFAWQLQELLDKLGRK